MKLIAVNLSPLESSWTWSVRVTTVPHENGAQSVHKMVDELREEEEEEEDDKP